MMRWVAMAMLLVAGCAANRPLTDQEQCERQAENDPAVKLLEEKGLGSPNFQASNLGVLRDTKADAVKACLRTRGIEVRGGVERERRVHY